jgi:predicted dehydrogenase
MHILLLGCGAWGRVILRDLLGLDVTVTVVESDEAARQQALQAGASEALSIIPRPGPYNGVVVATPASTHADVILALDRAGSNVPIFCEKPLADTGANAQRILDREGPPVYVMHIWCYHPGIRKLKQLLDDGTIGQPGMLHSVRTNWTSPRQDVDTLANMAPHDLAILQYLLGEIPPVTCVSAEYLAGVCVGAVISLQAPGGPPCVVEVSNRYGEKRREFRVHGSDGVLVLPDDSSGHLQLVAGSGYLKPDNIEHIDYRGASAMHTQLSAFLAFLGTGNDSALCPVRDGANVVQIIDQIRAMG